MYEMACRVSLTLKIHSIGLRQSRTYDIRAGKLGKKNVKHYESIMMRNATGINSVLNWWT